jgi:hypothetical protein
VHAPNQFDTALTDNIRSQRRQAGAFGNTQDRAALEPAHIIFRDDKFC